MILKELPQMERPREKLMLQGKEHLSNGELLSILLRTGTREQSSLALAQEILKLDEQGILFLGECTPEELSGIKGIGHAKACQILAAVELGKRIACLPRKERVKLTNPDEVARLFMEKMRYYKKEHFKVLIISAKGDIIEEKEISIGDLSSTVIHPREVFSHAIRRGAASVICVHNHPSGNPTPSEQDMSATKRLIQAAEILGIQVLDHIIIGDGTYISFKREGYME